MLKNLLAERMRNEHLSARTAAQQIGGFSNTKISHTTIHRILAGEIPNIENLVSICAWLGVSVAAVLGVETEQHRSLAARIEMMISADPRLEHLFRMLSEDYQNGLITSDDVEDILSYTQYRLSQRRGRNDLHASAVVLGSGGGN